MNSIPYEYRHCPVPGGGYATGFLYHPRREGLLYLRTDIGGSYRFDRESQRWICLIPHVTMEDLSLSYPISLAIDPDQPQRLFIACGMYHQAQGELAISDDYGDSFTVKPMPMFVHGNLSGRGTGERLILDAEDASTLWFASQRDGLWVTRDMGDSWQHIDALPETHLTFVLQLQGMLIVGAAGVATMADAMRGPALYISHDGGRSFRTMEQPASRRAEGCRVHGLAAQRWSADDCYLYVTFGGNGPRSFIDELGYSCDSGDAVDGHVVRYPLTAEGVGPMEDITPCAASPAAGSELADYHPGDMLPWGFSGIAASRNTPGLLIASAICKRNGDSIFMSRDHGATWEQILFGLTDGDIRFRTSYMRPEHNGNASIIHWLSDLKLNPFDDNESWFNTGTGVFRSFGLTTPQRYFTDWSDGVEETVHLNVYSMPSGHVKALDIIGDLGGFAFTDLDTPCRNSFDDRDGNRYITCINADFPDSNTDRIAVAARGNWTGRTKGGVILTTDNAVTWNRLPMPWGLTPEIDQTAQAIERPNTNPGWVAMAPDGQTIVWSMAQGIELPVTRVVLTRDEGQSWQRVLVYDLQGSEVTCGGFKVFADRVDSSLFYGFGDHSDLYLSCDGGATFRQLPTPENLPAGVHFAKIDCANKTEVRGEAGRSGRFLMALREHGLWTLQYENGRFTATRLSREGDWVYRAGFGLGEKGGDYITGHKAIYMNATIGGEYGFYRTFDDCATFQRINTARQMFGDIISIDGDCREFGQFFLATGSFGLIYGKEQ